MFKCLWKYPPINLGARVVLFKELIFCLHAGSDPRPIYSEPKVLGSLPTELQAEGLGSLQGVSGCIIPRQDGSIWSRTE